MPLLEVNNLGIDYITEKGTLEAVRGVSFSLERGQNLGLVGESGCGKTTVAKSLMKLLPSNGVISEGEIIFKGQDVVEMTPEKVRQIRWNDISMIAQSAMNAMDPVYKIKDQIIEVIKTHQSQVDKKEAIERAANLFELVGLERKRLNSYPHQLSGGMKQRAIIAMALALSPALVIADEPTTALDVVVQDRILHQIIKLQQEINTSMVFITHDISVVAETCDQIIVMYGGRIAEIGSTRDFFKDTHHPYGLGLQNAFPSINEIGERLISMPGSPPNLINPKPGCRFAPRCPFAEDVCYAEMPGLQEIKPGHYSACHFTDRIDEFREKAKLRETWEQVKERQIKKQLRR
ncbi:ABC transporter ATP-binding protein [Natroniella sp. ANB-PHB2]|uniref:ABC transporter ATP-binding protein n=1 Tax=Natroniella sp. ANB-PHB2 TaxID=3384444 RepID=UPI0038D47B1B